MPTPIKSLLLLVGRRVLSSAFAGVGLPGMVKKMVNPVHVQVGEGSEDSLPTANSQLRTLGVRLPPLGLHGSDRSGGPSLSPFCMGRAFEKRQLLGCTHPPTSM